MALSTRLAGPEVGRGLARRVDAVMHTDGLSKRRGVVVLSDSLDLEVPRNRRDLTE
jgi:hypothetical protein